MVGTSFLIIKGIVFLCVTKVSVINFPSSSFIPFTSSPSVIPVAQNIESPDTISFNLEERGDPIEGEVYISLDRVSENAKIFKQNFITECKRVIIHSCLHLLGYNDDIPEEKYKMTELEEIYLSRKIEAN